MGRGGCAKISATNAGNTLTGDSSKIPIRLISQKLLSSKCTVHECWIAYEGVVYDVTHWLSKHPGGIRAIMSAAGQDATSVMKSLHAPDTLDNYMRRVRRVGTLDKRISCSAGKSVALNAKADDAKNIDLNPAMRTHLEAEKRAMAIQADFSVLNDRLIREGWYEPKVGCYWAQIIRVLAFLCLGLSLIFYSQNVQATLWFPRLVSNVSLLIGSTLLGLFFQNLAFMGHDAGHGSITGNFRIDFWMGLIVGNALTGIDVSWWKSTHYVHHSATNSLHDDPDIQHMPFLCLDKRMVEDRWSTYHGKFMPLDAIAKALLPYQHLYFYPVMAVARINLYIQSILYLIKTRPFMSNTDGGMKVINERTGEIKEKYGWPMAPNAMWVGSVCSLMIFYRLMYTLLTSLDLKSALICFAISHMVAGILHVQIMLSHVAMHYCADGAGSIGADSAPNGYGEAGYYEWQALSTMDIACPPYMDWFHGGLQFQLEHHLFPRIPRWNLRKLMPLVDEIFDKYDIPVVRENFFRANCMMMRHVSEVGAFVAKAKTV